MTTSDNLSLIFAALADPTRRAILARLATGELIAVTELAKPFDMTLPAISKHLKVLERAGLIERQRDAQWRRVRIDVTPLRDISDWVDTYRRFWEGNFDRLDEYLQALQEQAKQGKGTASDTITNNRAENDVEDYADLGDDP